MQISRYAPKPILGYTLLGQRHTEEGTLAVCVAGTCAQYTHSCAQTCRGEGRLIMQYKDSHEVKIIFL